MAKETRNSEIQGGGMNRRELIQGSLMLAGVPPLCCTTDTVPEGSFSFDGDTLVLDLRKAAGLKAAGSALAVVDTGRKLNIIVAHDEKDRYAALDRVCTHGGAMCTYNHKRHTIRCTSLNHAEYDMKGTLLHGRTHGNIRAYEVKLAGASLRISLKKEEKS